MLEIPEAFVVARQVGGTLLGRRISDVVAAQTPHKLTWYQGDPRGYRDLLSGRRIDRAVAYGGLIEIDASETALLVGDGVGLRYHRPGAALPQKHQLLIGFEDGSALTATVRMYGGIWCFRTGEFDNPYYLAAVERPSPLSDAFDREYFERLIAPEEVQGLSVKAFLATEQRIPGLGNGVLQDIAWNARLHPKRKVRTLGPEDRDGLFAAVKETLRLMVDGGGRDTERDLPGQAGGYRTVMSRRHLGEQCPRCGQLIETTQYLGGSVYFCRACQREAVDPVPPAGSG